MAKIDAHVITAEEYEEIPELTDDFFEHADFLIGGKLIQRGRPRKEKTAKAVSIRLDPDVLEHFKASGKGWQTRINRALKEWLAEHPQA